MFEALELFISFHPFTRGFIWVVACSFPANIANNRVVTAPPLHPGKVDFIKNLFSQVALPPLSNDFILARKCPSYQNNNKFNFNIAFSSN
jgi:hypothetical protein